MPHRPPKGIRPPQLYRAGIRKGRPKGSKTRPLWERDLRWAQRNLGNPDAIPPTDGARYWASLAKERPGDFVAALRAQDVRPRVERPAVIKPPRRVKTLLVPEQWLFIYMLGRCGAGVPSDSRLVELAAVPEGIRFTIESDQFPLVADGHPIEALKPYFRR